MTKTEFWKLKPNDVVGFMDTPETGVVRSVAETDGAKAVWVRWASDHATNVYGEGEAHLIDRVGNSPDSLADGKDGRAILVWRFEVAPKEYQALSLHGGDEDWVAFVPDWYGGAPVWVQQGSFGCCDVSEHKVDGGTVHIGAHA